MNTDLQSIINESGAPPRVSSTILFINNSASARASISFLYRIYLTYLENWSTTTITESYVLLSNPLLTSNLLRTWQTVPEVRPYVDVRPPAVARSYSLLTTVSTSRDVLSWSARSVVLSTLIIPITVPTVRISLVYRKTRSLQCSCVQLIVHSDCLVYNNTKPLLLYFPNPCPLHRAPTRPLSHLTSHSRDGSHLGQGPNKYLHLTVGGLDVVQAGIP
jgi:hypothetical protein